MSNEIPESGARSAFLASPQAYKSSQIQELNKSEISLNMNGLGAGRDGLAPGKPKAAMGATDTSLEKQPLDFRTVETTAEDKVTQKNDQQERLENLREAVGKLNDQAFKNARNLIFSIDEELNRHVITVSNKETGEVVRQIPTEVVLRVAHNIEDIKGMLLDEEA